MPEPKDIHRVIRFLEERMNALKNERPREFVQQMVARLDQQRDTFYCSPKQARYLRSLAAQLGMNKEARQSGSRLQELKEKRAKLLKGIYKDLNRQESANVLTVIAVPELRRHQFVNTTARMRRDRSYKQTIVAPKPRTKGEE